MALPIETRSGEVREGSAAQRSLELFAGIPSENWQTIPTYTEFVGNRFYDVEGFATPLDLSGEKFDARLEKLRLISSDDPVSVGRSPYRIRISRDTSVIDFYLMTRDPEEALALETYGRLNRDVIDPHQVAIEAEQLKADFTRALRAQDVVPQD